MSDWLDDLTHLANDNDDGIELEWDEDRSVVTVRRLRDIANRRSTEADLPENNIPARDAEIEVAEKFFQKVKKYIQIGC